MQASKVLLLLVAVLAIHHGEIATPGNLGGLFAHLFSFTDISRLTDDAMFLL